jgi:hypothetical protein
MAEGHSYTLDLKGMNAKIDALSGDMKIVLSALQGNNFGDIGLAGRISRLEDINLLQSKELEELREWKSKAIGYTLGIGSASGLVISVVVNLII